jgi:outer membrane lipoprotein-sorting protein
MDTKRAVAGVALVALVGAAIAFFLFFGGPTATDIGEGMEESYADIEDYEGTMTVTVVQTTDREQVVNDTAIRRQARALAAENSSLSAEEAERRIRDSIPESGEVETFNHTTVANVSFAKPDRYRYDYVEQPPDPRIGAVTTNNTVATVYRRGFEPEQRPLGQGDETLVGIRLGDYVPTVTDDYDIALNETAATDDAYVLDLTPVTDFEGALDRVYVDRETNLPVRAERTVEETGSTTRTVVEYDYEYGVGVDGSVFDVDPETVDYPEVENVTEDGNISRVQRIRQNISETARERGLWEVENVTREEFDFDTVEEGEDWLGRDVPALEADFEGFDVFDVRGTTVDNNSSLTVAYRNSSNVFFAYYTAERGSRFASWPSEDENEIFEQEEVSVGDRTGELHYYEIESGYGRSVVGYDCDGLLVEIYTDNLPNDALVSAANAVGCS